MSDAVSESGAKKKHGCLKALGVVVAVVVVTIVALVLALSKKDEVETFTWPETELTAQIPTPSWADDSARAGKTTLEGELRHDSSTYFSCYVAASAEEYEEYVDACAEAGFTADYSRDSDSYTAQNEAGYELWLRYYDEDDSSYEVAVMYVSLYAPDEEDEAANEDAEDETADAAAAEDAAADDADAADAEANDAEGSSSDDTADASEVDPELAARLDAYEAFMDSYVDFMLEYADAGDADAAAMLADYAQMMAEYAELAAELEEWDTDEMSAADLAYYLEGTARVEARLLELYE